jgi:hypothetical protein
MKLASDWREVLRKAWSIRLIILAGVLTGLEALVPFLGTNVPYLKVITFGVISAAFIARITAQRDLK